MAWNNCFTCLMVGMGLMSLMGELLRHKLRRSINRGVKIPISGQVRVLNRTCRHTRWNNLECQWNNVVSFYRNSFFNFIGWRHYLLRFWQCVLINYAVLSINGSVHMHYRKSQTCHSNDLLIMLCVCSSTMQSTEWKKIV